MSVSVKILHVPFTYYPDACGGTEVYVAALCRFLAEAGVQNVIAAPAAEESSYEHEGIPVRRFAVSPELTQDMMFVQGDPVAAEGFAKVLDLERPDLVHFHARSPAVGVLNLREAQKRGIRTLSTYHTPTASCQRGTLMRWGQKACDGALRPTLCAACFLNAHGMPQALARFTAIASWVTQPLAKLPGLPNAARAILRAAPLVAGSTRATREWWASTGQIIALCDWTMRLLLLNGVPLERIRKVRHGLPTPAVSMAEDVPPLPLRLAFLGRLDPGKGIDLIIAALRLIPDLPLSLDLYTIQATRDDPVAEELLGQAQDDPRVRFKSPIPSMQVVGALRDYHALVVPSRWQETGPLVVLEAFAAGIPVIGSDLGGIAEWVIHEHNGLLVSRPTPDAWRDALLRLVIEPALLPKLRAGVGPPRTMREVAADMRQIYAQELAMPIP